MTTSSSAPSVLLVEDDRSFLFALSSALEATGFVVHAVTDGALALELLEQEAVDVVAVDVRLGAMSGVEVLRQVKRRRPELEVVVMTGLTDVGIAVDCLRAGAFDFLTKPFEAVQLQTALTRAVERRRLRDTSSLYAACERLLDSKPAEDLPRRIVNVTERALGADDVALYLHAGDDRLELLHGSPLGGQPFNPLALAERTAASHRPLLTTLRDEPGSGSVIGIPLRARDRPLGVLILHRGARRVPFRDTDVESAGILASQASLALENARLMREVVTTERLAAMGELVAGLSHELNNPIAWVLSNLQFVAAQLEQVPQPRDPALAETLSEVKFAAADALEGAERIRDLSRDVMAMSRSDCSDDLVDVEVPIRAALRVSAAALRTCSKLELALTPGLQVRASAGRLAQVFTNLFVNAAHAVEDVAPERRVVQVSSSVEADRVVIAVADQGPGIPRSVITRIFEPFFTTKPAGKGTGLGLPLSRDIVESLGGELRVRSVEGSGTVMEVVLPQVAAAAQTG